MGKTKGKKLWRKAIDTQEIEDALEESTRKEREKHLVENVPDSELFYVDKEQDAALAAAVEKGAPLSRRKKAPKLLRCQTILNAAHAAKPVNPVASRKKLRGPAVKSAGTKAKALGPQNEPQRETAVDVWEDRIGPDPAVRPASQRKIRSVEVDLPGCSFNPEEEQHQDALAEAVAAEMTKVYAKEHLPLPNRRFNHLPPPDELTALLANGDDEEEEGDEDQDQDQDAEVVNDAAELWAEEARGNAIPEKKTRTDRNRDKRRRDAEEEYSAKQELKKQRRDLDRLSDFNAEIAQQEILQKARAIRKAVTKAEKALSEPPKLGKQKFQPANIQVLLSEEVDGSLRRLKGVPLLTKDRFKALQKQGLIEPRLRVEPMRRRKRVTYQTGDRSERLKAGHEETQKLTKSRDRALAKAKNAK